MVCPAGKTEKLKLIRIPRSGVAIVAGDRAGGTGISNPVPSTGESANPISVTDLPGEALGELLGFTGDLEFDANEHPPFAFATSKFRRLDALLVKPHAHRCHLARKFARS